MNTNNCSSQRSLLPFDPLANGYECSSDSQNPLYTRINTVAFPLLQAFPTGTCADIDSLPKAEVYTIKTIDSPILAAYPFSKEENALFDFLSSAHKQPSSGEREEESRSKATLPKSLEDSSKIKELQKSQIGDLRGSLLFIKKLLANLPEKVPDFFRKDSALFINKTWEKINSIKKEIAKTKEDQGSDSF